MAVVMAARMKVLPQKRQELLRTLAAMEEKTGQIGCRKYHYRQDQEDENLIRLTLEWQSREKLDSYLASSHHQVLMGAIQVLCESPVITFHTKTGLMQGGNAYAASQSGKA